MSRRRSGVDAPPYSLCSLCSRWFKVQSSKLSPLSCKASRPLGLRGRAARVVINTKKAGHRPRLQLRQHHLYCFGGEFGSCCLLLSRLRISSVGSPALPVAPLPVLSWLLTTPPVVAESLGCFPAPGPGTVWPCCVLSRSRRSSASEPGFFRACDAAS